MDKESGKFIALLRKARLLRVLLFALSLLVLTDILVRWYTDKPGLVLRNEGHNPIAIPYLLKQMRQDKNFTVAWPGSSILQGIHCTTAKTTAPVQVENILQGQGYSISCYNLAHIGNVVADNFCITRAAANHGADAVVFELVFGLFPGRGSGIQTAKLQHAWYMRDMADFQNVRTELLKLPKKEWNANYLYMFAKDYWALLKYREVLLHHFTGRHEDPATQIGDQAMLAAGMKVIRQNNDVYADLPGERNVDHYWKKLKPGFIKVAKKMFTEKTANLDLTVKDPKIRMIARACIEARNKGVPVLYYFAPINREILDRTKAMNWEVYDKYEQTLRAVLEHKLTGCEVVDLSEAIESRHFTDSQHLNMKGHRRLAEELAPHILKLYEQKAGVK